MAVGTADTTGPVVAASTTELDDIEEMLADIAGWVLDEHFQELFCPLTVAPLVARVLVTQAGHTNIHTNTHTYVRT